MKITRRRFLKLGGSAAAGTAAFAGGGLLSPAGAAEKSGDAGRVTLNYPEKSLGTASSLKDGEAVSFNYPDSQSPCAVVKLGRAAPGGVGPDGDIVAYSILCSHMGCPVQYSPETRTFKCPCHFSVFDAEMSGEMVSGQATVNLPRILLSYDAEKDTVAAIGVEGLIYGRQANVIEQA
ncbi:MAG: arsenate reductase (azurin) small subunit [Ectothiorhodospiraceae bacterium]|jgi:arsenite oxidase small subunit